MTRRAIARLAAGSFAPEAAAECITLDYDRRHRRRLRLQTDSGQDILLDLPEAAHFRDGDAMELEDGGCVLVRAAPEAVLEISALDPQDLLRLAWHLGNRHLAVQFLPGGLRILDDHVIAEMVRGLGGEVRAFLAPFDPESGAYHAH